MLAILIRTIIVYTCLLIAMRLMGKRQIGQLEVTDFIASLLISEIASLPIENPDTPILYAIIPIAALLTFEVSSSALLAKSQFMKNIFSSRPSFLVKDGIPDQKELLRNRISLDELLSELRQQNANDLSEVKYAILEQDGKITVIPRSAYQPPTLSDLNIQAPDKGISHILISHGRLNAHGLDTVGKTVKWAEGRVHARGLEIKDVFLMTLNDDGHITIIKKDRKGR